MATNDEDPATIKARRLQREREQEERAEKRRAVVRGHMESRGLSQKELCDMAGLRNANTLNNFLAGRSRSLNMETLEPLAKALGLSVSQFIGDTAPEPAAAISRDIIEAEATHDTLRIIVEAEGGRRIIIENPSERLIYLLLESEGSPISKKRA